MSPCSECRKAMLRLSKLTDYALLVSHHLVKQSNPRCNMSDIAAGTHLSLATVRKVLKKLVDAGLVFSYRGAQGGYCLARHPERISLAQVITAMEGPLALTECNQAGSQCDIEPYCELSSSWHQINRWIGDLLQSISLLELTRPVVRFQPSFNVLPGMQRPKD